MCIRDRERLGWLKRFVFSGQIYGCGFIERRIFRMAVVISRERFKDRRQKDRPHNACVLSEGVADYDRISSRIIIGHTDFIIVFGTYERKAAGFPASERTEKIVQAQGIRFSRRIFTRFDSGTEACRFYFIISPNSYYFFGDIIHTSDVVPP